MKYGVTDLVLLAYLRASTDDGCIRANDKVVVSLPCKMRANSLKRWLSRITRDFVVDLVAAILAFASTGEIDRTLPDYLGWLLCQITETMIISVPKCQATSLKRERHGDAFLEPFMRRSYCNISTSFFTTA